MGEDINLHELRTKHLNHIENRLKDLGSEQRTTFKVSMYGKTKQMRKVQISSHPANRWLKAAVQQLKDQENLESEDVNQVLTNAFRKTTRYLLEEDYEGKAEDIQEDLDRLDGSFESLTVGKQVREYRESLVNLEITTNLTELGFNPKITAVDEENDETVASSSGEFNQLIPEGSYQVKVSTGEQVKQRMVEIEGDKSIHFEFDEEQFQIPEKEETDKVDNSSPSVSLPGISIKKPVKSAYGKIKKLISWKLKIIGKILKLSLQATLLLVVFIISYAVAGQFI